MNTSPTIGSISAALAKAQGEMQNPVKDRVARVKSDKADYTYNYADLANVLDCVRPVLAKNGVAIIQSPEVSGDLLTMHTRLIHSSGEWIESQLSSGIDPQAKIQTLGSAISYLRRYALQAIVGVVAEEDDDGNASDGRQAQTTARERPPAKSAPAAAPAAPATPAAVPAADPVLAKAKMDAQAAYDPLAKLAGTKFAKLVWNAVKIADGAKLDDALKLTAQRTSLLRQAYDRIVDVKREGGDDQVAAVIDAATRTDHPVDIAEAMAQLAKLAGAAANA